MYEYATAFDWITAHAGEIAMASGAVAVLLVAGMLAYAARTALRARDASRAARMLVDAHLDALEARLERTAAISGPMHARSEQLAVAVAGLGGSVRQLGTILRAISAERSRMLRRIVDVVLPTDDGARRAEPLQ